MRISNALWPLAVVGLLLGCRGSEPNTASPRGNVRIAVITHGQASDPFWSVVVNGVRAAARDLGVRVDYQAPTRFDMVEMSNLIDAAVAARPSALVISIPDASALSQSIRHAVEAGIPVLSINSGAQASRELGLLAHIGQSEYDAGHAAGERLAAAGARRVLCVNHEVGNAGLDERCRGLGDALSGSNATMRVLGIELSNPDDAQQRIMSALRAEPAIDALLTLGPGGALPALAAVHDLNNPALKFATFDLSPDILTAVRDGSALFAIDQQQYLQGYLPIVLLTNYLETLTLPGGGKVIPTGPAFVTREQAERVMALTARGIR